MHQLVQQGERMRGVVVVDDDEGSQVIGQRETAEDAWPISRLPHCVDDGSIQYGYRFVWRRQEDGSIQAARGQARIPSYAYAKELMDNAAKAGWGDRDGDELEAAAERLRQAGCVVDFASGFVKWPDKEAADKGHLTPETIADARLIADWTH